MSEIFGIDVSHHQGVIDWRKVAESGIKFAIMKCQYESKGHRIDEQFENNYKGCVDNGLSKGVYIYIARASMDDVVGDANALLNHLNGRKLECGIWLDLEDKTVDIKGKAYIRNLAFQYADIFMKAGYDVGIYTNRDWYLRLIHDDLKRDFDIWFARYPRNDKGIYNPNSTLKPSTNIAVCWQYSSKGKVPGINGNCDLDVNFDGRFAIAEKKIEESKKVIIGSARSDENKKYSGGKDGDQRQTESDDYSGEVSLQEFYVHKKGWIILRHDDTVVAKKIADSMRTACNNINIGYDQGGRYKIIKSGIGTNEPTECDCSSLIRACVIKATGKDPGDFTTGNEVSVLSKIGFKSHEFLSESDLKEGDILVTKTKGHTVAVTDITEKKNPYREPVSFIKIGMCGVAVKWIQYQLNLFGYGLKEDGIFGRLTDACVKDFQEHHKLVDDGIVGPLTREALKEMED